jgi:hypothetical protein
MAAFNSLQRMVNIHEEFLEELVERIGRHVRGSFFMSAPDNENIDSLE